MRKNEDIDFYQSIVNPNAPVIIIAEMAWAHDGCVEKAKKIIKGAAEAKANAINLHVTSLPHYMTENYGSGKGRVSQTENMGASVYAYLDRINLSFADFKALACYAKSLSLRVSVMCNDQQSLSYVATEIKPDLLMIHPACVTDDAFVQAAARYAIPILLYCGGLSLGEIEQAVMVCKAAENEKLILQHGFQSYPTHIEDNHLRYLTTLKETFNLPISFGDHTDGADPMALMVPLLAIPFGVRVIEKHITFERSEKGEDYESALGLNEFATFLRYVRAAEQALGSSATRPLSDRELHYRQVVIKRAIAYRDIQPGEYLLPAHIIYKRSDAGLLPKEAQMISGKIKIGKKIHKNEPITWESLA